MLSKNQIKALTRYRQDKYRKEDNVFVVEGCKLAQEVLQSGLEVEAVYATRSWIGRNPFEQWALTESNSMKTDSEKKKTESRFDFTDSKKRFLPSLVEVTQEELERISLLSTPNDVYCLVRRPERVTDYRHDGLTLVLDGIRDPGNLGTIIRLADWFAVNRVICSKDCVDMYNPKTVQSTMGSLFRVEVFYCDLEDFFKRLPSGFDVYGSLVEKGDSVYGQQLSENSVLVIGSESHGISERVRKYINRSLNIPCFKHGNRPESLNAAMACAVLLSEFRRNG